MSGGDAPAYNAWRGLHAAYTATSCILEEENKRQKREMLCHLSVLRRLDVDCALFHSVPWPLDAQFGRDFVTATFLRQGKSLNQWATFPLQAELNLGSVGHISHPD